MNDKAKLIKKNYRNRTKDTLFSSMGQKSMMHTSKKTLNIQAEVVTQKLTQARPERQRLRTKTNLHQKKSIPYVLQDTSSFPKHTPISQGPTKNWQTLIHKTNLTNCSDVLFVVRRLATRFAFQSNAAARKCQEAEQHFANHIVLLPIQLNP